MRLHILFGLPGSGKTFVGNVFKDYFNYSFYEGDTDFTEEMKYAISKQIPFADVMRGVFFNKLISHIQQVKDQHENLVVAQAFIKEKYRQ